MRRYDHKLLAGRSPAHLGLHVEATQNSVDDVCQVTVYSQNITFTQFYEDVKCGSRLAFENALLCPMALCFFITQCNRLDTSEQVDEGRVGDKVAQIVAMCRSNELDATLSDRPACLRFFDAADLIYDDDFRIVVLHGFDHDIVLLFVGRYLHTARRPNATMRNVTIPADLIAGIDNDDAFFQRIADVPGSLAQQSRLAYARSAQYQDARAFLDEVFDDLDLAVQGAPDPARQSDHVVVPVPDGGNAMQRLLDSAAVVAVEFSNFSNDRVDVSLCHPALAKGNEVEFEPSFRDTSEVQHDLDELVESVDPLECLL